MATPPSCPWAIMSACLSATPRTAPMSCTMAAIIPSLPRARPPIWSGRAGTIWWGSWRRLPRPRAFSNSTWMGRSCRRSRRPPRSAGPRGGRPRSWGNGATARGTFSPARWMTGASTTTRCPTPKCRRCTTVARLRRGAACRTKPCGCPGRATGVDSWQRSRHSFRMEVAMQALLVVLLVLVPLVAHAGQAPHSYTLQPLGAAASGVARTHPGGPGAVRVAGLDEDGLVVGTIVAAERSEGSILAPYVFPIGVLVPGAISVATAVSAGAIVGYSEEQDFLHALRFRIQEGLEDLGTPVLLS